MAAVDRSHPAGSLIGVASTIEHRFCGIGFVQTIGQWGQGLWVATFAGIGDPIQGGQRSQAAPTLPILDGQLIIQNVCLPLRGQSPAVDMNLGWDNMAARGGHSRAPAGVGSELLSPVHGTLLLSIYTKAT